MTPAVWIAFALLAIVSAALIFALGWIGAYCAAVLFGCVGSWVTVPQRCA